MSKHKYLFAAALLVVLFASAIWVVQREGARTRETIESAGARDAAVATIEEGRDAARDILQDIHEILETSPRRRDDEPVSDIEQEDEAPVWKDDVPSERERRERESADDRPESPFSVLTDIATDVARTVDEIGQEVFKLSDEQEMEIGRELFEHVKEDIPLLDDPRVNDKMRQLAAPLLEHRARRAVNYHIAIIDDDSFNAFALAGGYIFVTRGALERCTNDSELALLLGHEIGHVDLRHSAELITYSAAARNLAGEAAAAVAQVLYHNLSIGYSAAREFEADEYAVRVISKAGHDAEKALGLFDRMMEFEREMGIEHEPAEPKDTLEDILRNIERYFQTHPPTRERKERAAAIAAELAEQNR